MPIRSQGLPALGAALILACGSPARAEPAPALPKAELAKAAAEHNVKKIDKLLATPAPIDEADAKGRTALIYAAAQGDLELVNKLLAKGAAADVKDTFGATPLIEALKNPATSPDLVKALLAKGADVNASDRSGRTPLMEAVLRAPQMIDTDAQVAMVKTLLAAGANPAMNDASGATALHQAAYAGEPRKVLEIMLGAAKDPNITTVSGANALMMAAQNRQRINADFLMSKGLRPVRVKLVEAPGAPKAELAQDLSARTNAIAQDWWGQYATKKGDAAAARDAFGQAAKDYEAAVQESKRLVAAYEVQLMQDKKARGNARAAAGVASVLMTAVTLGAGYTVMYSPNLQTDVERDEQAIATLKTEIDEMTARAAALRTQASATT